MLSDFDPNIAARQRLADAVSAVCWRCRTTNTLTVLDTMLRDKVHCSHCGAELGTLLDLTHGAKATVDRR